LQTRLTRFAFSDRINWIYWMVAAFGRLKRVWREHLD